MSGVLMLPIAVNVPAMFCCPNCIRAQLVAWHILITRCHAALRCAYTYSCTCAADRLYFLTGGGVAVVDDAKMVISNSTIRQNVADGGGAGIATFYNAVLLITDGSTIMYNNASSDFFGGGLAISESSHVTITGEHSASGYWQQPSISTALLLAGIAPLLFYELLQHGPADCALVSQRKLCTC